MIGANGAYTFTPDANYNGTVPTVSYTVTDGSGNNVTSTLNISVTPVNDNFTDANETVSTPGRHCPHRQRPHRYLERRWAGQRG